MQDLKDRGVDIDSIVDEDSDSDDEDIPGLKEYGYHKTVVMMLMMIAILSVEAKECDNKNFIKVQEYSRELHHTQE